MKRTAAIVLAAAICLSLCACTGLPKVDLPPVPTPAPSAAPTPEPQETLTPSAPAETTVTEKQPTGPVIVSISGTEQLAYDPQYGETLILRFSYETPKIIDETNPEAAEKVNEFAALLNEAFITGEDYGEGAGVGYNNMLTAAEDNYSMHMEMQEENPNLELYASRQIAVPRNDGTVLTLLFNDSSYNGGVHGGYSTRAYSFDMSSGERLTLADLGQDETALRALLVGEMLRQAREDARIAEQIGGYVQEEELEEKLSALLRSGSWYLNHDGMLIFSDEYEISDYASGPVTFHIPADKLSGLVEERYLIAPTPSGGSLRAVPQEALADGSTEIVDMVKISDDGTTVYLVADGEVCDLRIASVDYFDHNSSFVEKATHWSCSSLKAAAVQLVTVLPDGMPNLLISWRGAEGEQSVLLTQSGEDGSPILMPSESIEAVG